MKCPYCGCADTKVLDSRSLEKKKRRRRECPSCLKRFTTYEVLDVPLLMVKKKDGSFEPFDKNKLIKGIYSAIKKRPVSVEDERHEEPDHYGRNRRHRPRKDEGPRRNSLHQVCIGLQGVYRQGKFHKDNFRTGYEVKRLLPQKWSLLI